MMFMQLKRDKFRESRGGYSRALQISCGNCRRFICYYQKDGPGPLKRLYIDRILDLKVGQKKAGKLVCKSCKQCLGVASTYQKEHRKCFILFQDSVTKRIIKS